MGLVLAIGWSLTVAGECPEIQKLREFYREKPYIELKFHQLTHSDIFESVDTLEGQLWAGQQGRFRLTMPDQELVSNGVLYWSYSVENEQALVDSVAKLGDWNPLTLLYDPEQVYSCQNQKAAGETLEFEMTALDSLTLPQRFVLEVAKQGYVPRKISYLDDNDSRIEVIIDGFSRPAELPDSLFIFQAPPGVEVIEMP